MVITMTGNLHVHFTQVCGLERILRACGLSATMESARRLERATRETMSETKNEGLLLGAVMQLIITEALLWWLVTTFQTLLGRIQYDFETSNFN
jgi:hypothetical protein